MFGCSENVTSYKVVQLLLKSNQEVVDYIF
jgi:hypothetical protein